MLTRVKRLVVPNQKVSNSEVLLIWTVWAAVALGLWHLWPSALLPRPLEVAEAFVDLVMNEGLTERLFISYWIQIKALVFAAVISLVLSYLAQVAIFRPFVIFISTLRFISLGPLVVFFTLFVSSDGNVLTTALLIFSIAVFYITSMLPVILEIPIEEFEHAQTLRMDSWWSVWEVSVLGKADVALDQLRQNAAMGWMMLTMVEGLVRSQGGIGVLLLNDVKHFKLPEVTALLLVLFIVGILQDLVLRYARSWIFPYSNLGKERR